MGSIDVLLFSAIVVAVWIAAVSRRLWLRYIVALGLVMTIAICCLGIGLLPRVVLTRGTAARGWSEAYRDGVDDMSSAVDPYLLYFLLCGAGLAVLVIRTEARESVEGRNQ